MDVQPNPDRPSGVPPSPHPEPPEHPHQEPLDLAVLRSLLSLTDGEPSEFAEFEIPPGDVLKWIRQADRRQLNGLLFTALNRWHLLRRETGPPPAPHAPPTT